MQSLPVERYQAYLQLLERQPDHPEALSLLGGLCLEFGHTQSALLLLRQALLQEPHRSEHWVNLALAQAQARTPELAWVSMRQALRRNSGLRRPAPLDALWTQELPTQLEAMLGGQFSLALELHCACGRVGQALRHRCRTLVGLVPSPGRQESLRRRNVYDRLEVAPVLPWLEGSQEAFDLVFCVNRRLARPGDVNRLLAAVRPRLSRGGCLVFLTRSPIKVQNDLEAQGLRSIESQPWLQLTPAGRVRSGMLWVVGLQPG